MDNTKNKSSGNIDEREKVFKLIEKNNNIAIFHHVSPDGDCLGSSNGLYEILKENYPEKNIKLFGNRNNAFMWMELTEHSEEGFDFENAIGIIMDVSNKTRIEKFDLLTKCKKGIVRIDHHPNKDDYDPIATVLLVNRPATCQIVAELAIDYGWKVTPSAATKLYLGLLTDTGRFLFRSVSKDTYLIAAKLVEWGAQRDFVQDNLYKRDENSIRFNSEILMNYKKSNNNEVIYFHITKKMQEQYGLKPDECARVNILANIEEYKAWLFFIDYEDSIRVEFRCKPQYKINEVAYMFGGGGHDQAAGCRIDNEDKINDVVNAVSNMKKQM